MRKVFGWPYTQHETYYVMVGGKDSKVFLGLREGVDVKSFQERAHAAHHSEEPFDIEQYVQTFPAEPHQLFVIPAGTPHGSGEGNVVLEVSATPYLYSLRFYDWLRRDADGGQRPVHVEHAFRNLDTERTGRAVAPTTSYRSPARCVAATAGTRSCSAPFRRCSSTYAGSSWTVTRRAPDDTGGRFHVLNVVDGRASWSRPSPDTGTPSRTPRRWSCRPPWGRTPSAARATVRPGWSRHSYDERAGAGPGDW